MDKHFLMFIVSTAVLPLPSLACPGGSSEKFCPDRNGCVASSRNCTDGVILTCVNETSPCKWNGTLHCVDVRNFTCGNFSCSNWTKYCPGSKSCIKMNESCCTEHEEACLEVMEYTSLFKKHGSLDVMCGMIRSSANFSANYTLLKYKNPLKEESCENDTYFCPLTLACIPLNCRLWNDGSKEWQLSGCTGHQSINNSIVECNCTQLGYITVFKGQKIIPTTVPPTTATTEAPENPEEAINVQFAFVANYSATISGNITKAVFISHVQTLLASLLNISESRISNVDIQPGNIIVSFSILPANNSDQASVNASVVLLQRLVSGGHINLTVPGLRQVIRVDPNSFLVVMSVPTQSTTKSRDDEEDLSSAAIAIVVVVCSIALLAVIAAFFYYFLRVRPTARSKISPRGPHMQLEGQPSNEAPMIRVGVNNNAVVEGTEEKAL